jgi:hypothetical protein
MPRLEAPMTRRRQANGVAPTMRRLGRTRACRTRTAIRWPEPWLGTDRRCDRSADGRHSSPANRVGPFGPVAMRSISAATRSARGAWPEKLSAAERSAVNHALANALPSEMPERSQRLANGPGNWRGCLNHPTSCRDAPPLSSSSTSWTRRRSFRSLAEPWGDTGTSTGRLILPFLAAWRTWSAILSARTPPRAGTVRRSAGSIRADRRN